MTHINDIKNNFSPREFCKEINKRTGKFIYDLRKDKHVQLKELKSELNVSVPQMRKYELGINRLCIGRLLLVFNYLECDIQEFIKEIIKNFKIPLNNKRIPAFKNADKLTPKQYKLVEKLIDNIIENN
jgi:transcriptional regulator with XRE-family HTH domain